MPASSASWKQGTVVFHRLCPNLDFFGHEAESSKWPVYETYLLMIKLAVWLRHGPYGQLSNHDTSSARMNTLINDGGVMKKPPTSCWTVENRNLTKPRQMVLISGSRFLISSLHPGFSTSLDEFDIITTPTTL